MDLLLKAALGAAVVVTLVAYRLAPRMLGRPLLGDRFHQHVSQWNRDTLLGAALFGVGWGIAGFCPGGALPALGTGQADVFVFVAALIAGIFAAKRLMALTHARSAALLRREGVLGDLLTLAEACESSDDAVFHKAAGTLHLTSQQINLAHLQALAWADQMAD